MEAFRVAITAYAVVTFPRPIVNTIYMLGNQITYKLKKNPQNSSMYIIHNKI